MAFASEPFFTVILALIGGIVPALVWLYFWNREDRRNPEPKGLILLAFLGGMAAVLVSLYLEKIAYNDGEHLIASSVFAPILGWLKSLAVSSNVPLNEIILVAVFAPFIEELSKFFMAYVLVLRSRADDEPIDPVIYLITTALGFAALENALFLIEPLSKNQLAFTFVTENMRFIGATLLHTVSSAAVGFFIGFNFFGRKVREFSWTLAGLLCAILIHAAFNILMVGSDQSSFIALEIIWLAVIAVLLAFERIKRVRLERIAKNASNIL